MTHLDIVITPEHQVIAARLALAFIDAPEGYEIELIQPARGGA